MFYCQLFCAQFSLLQTFITIISLSAYLSFWVSFLWSSSGTQIIPKLDLLYFLYLVHSF